MTYQMAACLFSCFAMTGLIWLVQIVHYPLFAMVGEEKFAAYEAAHTKRITPIVLPLMAVELVTSIRFALSPPSLGVPPWHFQLGGVMVLGIWFSTFLLQVPQHRRLEQGFESTAWRSLVTTNWLRTALWTAHSIQLIIAATAR